MIESITIKAPTKLPVKWWNDVKPLKDHKKIEFTDGLNVLWGPNGCGKSSILKLIARYMHCEQGGYSLVTDTSLQEVCDYSKGFLDGARIKHCGQAVFHIDPSHAAGLVCGGAAFDYDFTTLGVANIMDRRSSGQTTTMRINMVLRRLLEEKITTIEHKVKPHTDHQQAAVDFLCPTIKGGSTPKVTLLMDEPDRSLDYLTSFKFWRSIVPKFARDFQVIVATHQPAVLKDGMGANLIDVDKGYLDVCKLVSLTPEEIEAIKKKKREQSNF